MCEFCSKHGQGNRWYLNPENFSDEMMQDPQRVKTLEKVAGWGIEYYIDFTSRVTRLINWPVIGKAVKAAVNRMAPNEHGGQVVSLEDSLRLLEYARDFVLLPCECRRLVARYRIVPRFAYFCDGCGECLPVCRQNAITLISRQTGEEVA